MDTTAEAKLCWAKVVVRVADAKGTGRELLRNVYGCAVPGQLHAIMGPSGTSLAARSVAALDACADKALCVARGALVSQGVARPRCSTRCPAGWRTPPRLKAP
jgi:hypothetical protein